MAAVAECGRRDGTPQVSTRFSLGVENEPSNAGRDDRENEDYSEGCCCGVLRVGASSPPVCLGCHAAFISASTQGPAYQPCAPRGR